jgi:hypothetical protein
MTEVRELPTDDTASSDDQSIREAMALIDRGLGDISDRTIVSTSEMADLLLDVRGLLSRLDAIVSIDAPRLPNSSPRPEPTSTSNFPSAIASVARDKRVT